MLKWIIDTQIWNKWVIGLDNFILQYYMYLKKYNGTLLPSTARTYRGLFVVKRVILFDLHQENIYKFKIIDYFLKL